MAKELSLSIEDVAAILGVAVPAGMAGQVFTGVSTLDAAEPCHVTYVLKDRFAAAARRTRGGVVLAPPHIALDRPGIIVLPNVMVGLVRLLKAFHPDPHRESFVHPTAVVDDGVMIGPEVWIGPRVVIEEGVHLGAGTRIEAGCYVGRDVQIGPECWLSPHVTLMHETVLGARVRLHPGVVIGADGFRLELIEGRPTKVPQVGRVVIEDDVEIGANSTVDRASLTETRVGARTKIDNLVQVGHNVVIESDCVIVAQVGIGGSARIGRGTLIGGQAGLKDNITLGPGCRIGGRSGVQSSLPARSEFMGNPAMPVKDYARFTVFMRNFPATWERLRRVMESVPASPPGAAPLADEEQGE